MTRSTATIRLRSCPGLLRAALAVICLSLTLGSTACKNRDGLATGMAQTQDLQVPGSGVRCKIGPSHLRPLVVEWASGDRAALESRLMNQGLVAVNYNGCDPSCDQECNLEVLRYCTVPGNYRYKALTVKRDGVVIHNNDELSAFLPIGALQLRAKLRRAGRLSVDMVLTGTHEADQVDISRAQLTGRCEGATHVIAAAQVGAFEFFAGGEGEFGAGVAVQRAGVGVRSSATRETLGSDGDVHACAAAPFSPGRPSAHCGALLRIEMVPLVEDGRSPAENQAIADKRIPPPWRPRPAPLADPFDAPPTEGPEDAPESREPPPEPTESDELTSTPPRSRRPWKGMAAGAAVSLAGSATMAIVTAIGAARTKPLEEQFVESSCPMDDSAPSCVEFDRKGHIANSMQTAGLITMPILLAAGITLLVVALRRKSASSPQQALLPRISGLAWELKF